MSRLTKGYGVAILATESTRQAAPELAFLEVDLVRVVGAPSRCRFTRWWATKPSRRRRGGGGGGGGGGSFRALAADHAELIAAYRAADPDRADAALARARTHGAHEVKSSTRSTPSASPSYEPTRPRGVGRRVHPQIEALAWLPMRRN